MTYSAKAQEKFFLPVRIQVVECRIRSCYSSYKFWRVVQRNVITGQVIAVWTEPVWWPTNDLWKGDKLNKGKAIEVSKRQALMQALAFDPKADLVDEDDITVGPQQNCVACGQPAGRAKAPLICEACKNALAAGRTALAERQNGLIESDDLLTTHAGFDAREHADRTLAELLVCLAGSRIGASCNWQERKSAAFVIRAGVERSREVTASWISLSPAAAETMQRIVDWINDHLKAAYLEGHRHGESILLELASGELSLDDLNKHQRDLATQMAALRSKSQDDKSSHDTK